MPVLERDPWRFQFFQHVPCPEDAVIQTDDPDCWTLYPGHRWIYDKLKIASSQQIACGPHGVLPRIIRCLSKPVINLKGMGIGSRVISRGRRDGPRLAARPHVDGTARRAACLDRLRRSGREGGDVEPPCDGRAVDGGMFRHWTIHAAAFPDLDAYLARWVARHMDRLRRHDEFRDRRPHHRGASAVCRSVVRPIRRGLGGGARRPLCPWALAVRQFQPA